MPTKPLSIAPVAAEVRQDEQSEAALIQRVKQSISKNNWTIGECASLWTARWAKGRTDEDFGAAVGMNRDQVCQRRLVWDRWGTKCDTYHNLSWSHFYAALNWEDAEACLQWACDNYATVAEMKAWRESISQPVDSGKTGNSGGDPFGSDGDPFGEGAEGAGTDSGTETGGAAGEEDGTDADREEPDQEDAGPARPPRSGKDEPEREPKTQKELFADQKAKTIKTFEAASRAIADLNDLRKVPQTDAIVKSCRKVIETVKSFK